MKLILTRHGETIENKKGIRQGQTLQGKLSKEGRQQAKKLSVRLKNEKFDAIYSSDLGRNIDTTKDIIKYHPNVPVFFVKELREIDLGSLAGKKWEPIDWNNPPKDIETIENMCKRAKKLLYKVYKKYPKGNILFVGHGGINRALISIIMNKTPKYIKKIEYQHNTCVNTFEIREDKKHKVHLLNCTKHLK